LAAESYPAKLLNWNSDDPTNLPLDRANAELPDKVLVGGIDYSGWLLHSTPSEIGYKIDQLKAEFTPDRLILAPGCAIEPKTPKENLRVIRDRL